MSCAGNGTCQAGVVHPVVRKPKFGSVEQIERLGPELQVPALGELEILKGGEIDIVLCRAAQGAASCIAEKSGESLAGSNCRHCVSRGVVPALDSLVVWATHAGGIGKVVWVSNDIRARRSRAGVRRIKRQERCEGLPRVHGDDAIQLPALREPSRWTGAGKETLPGPDGKFIRPRRSELVPVVGAVVTTLGFEIMGILRLQPFIFFRLSNRMLPGVCA